jgi:hypothetical protein
MPPWRTASAPTPASPPRPPTSTPGCLPRHGHADDHGRRPRRPRGDAAAGLARRRRRERHREARAAPRRRAGAARGVARAPDHRHPLLAPGDIVPTIVGGGTWMVTYPGLLRPDLRHHLPAAHVDAEGTGKAVEAEVIDRLTAAVADDPWFAEHPLRFSGATTSCRPRCRPTIRWCHGARLRRAARPPDRQARRPRLVARRRHLHRAGTPTFSFGPDGIDSAHAVNECVSSTASSTSPPHRPHGDALVRGGVTDKSRRSVAHAPGRTL